MNYTETNNRLLNNLLEIRPNDKTIFTKLNNTLFFDLHSLIDEKSFDRINNYDDFEIELKNWTYSHLKRKITGEKNPNTIIGICDKYNFKLSKTDTEGLSDKKNLTKTKSKILNKLTEIENNFIYKWEYFARKNKLIQEEENIWSAHIATIYVSYKKNNKSIYAPLVLKEISIKIDKKNNKVIISNNSLWKFNEKLFFILDLNNIKVNTSGLKIDEFNLSAIFRQIEFNHNQKDLKFYSKFTNLKRDDINEAELKFYSGASIGLFTPEGGNLKKVLKEIITKKDLRNILQTNHKLVDQEKKIDKSFLENKKIYTIQEINHSQRKAIYSSLFQDTIIWGPPGTGKSQTITNIIANILHNDNSAVVTSQKAQALKVIKERLGPLSKYCFFASDKSNVSKEEFYRNLNSLVDKINGQVIKRNSSWRNYYDRDDRLELEYVNSIKEKNLYSNISNTLRYLYKENLEVNSYNRDLFDKILSLSDKYRYENQYFNNKKDLIDSTLELNNVKKKGLIVKRTPRSFKKNIYKMNDYLSQVSLDPNILRNLFPLTNSKELSSAFLSLKDSSSNNYENDVEYLESVILNNLVKRLNKIQVSSNAYDVELYNKYSTFTNAVRSKRLLPSTFINKFKEVINYLFKVVITTPETNLLVWKKNYYDYSIVDEASQMFIEKGLPILYISKTRIIAGDDKQMQPSSWFITRENVNDDVLDFSEEDERAILDYARIKNTFSILLDKNYRSNYASLMTFSSKNFYNSKLDVVDRADYYSNPIEVIDADGSWEKGVNQVEAKMLLSVLKKYLNINKKIIILTFNSKQENYIYNMILKNHPYLLYAINENKIILKSLENIQGDEADLVICSVVYDKNTRFANTYIGRKNVGSNSLNVAISRAKDKFIVIKSIDSTDVDPINNDLLIFKEWLSFIESNENDRKTLIKSESQLVSGSDKITLQERLQKFLERNLSSDKYKIVRNYGIGSLSLDLSIFDFRTNKFLLGVVSDTYQYGNDINKWLVYYDGISYLEKKDYSTIVVKDLNWSKDWRKEANKIIDKIKEKRLNMNKTINNKKVDLFREYEILLGKNINIRSILVNQREKLRSLVKNNKLSDQTLIRYESNYNDLSYIMYQLNTFIAHSNEDSNNNTKKIVTIQNIENKDIKILEKILEESKKATKNNESIYRLIIDELNY